MKCLHCDEEAMPENVYCQTHDCEDLLRDAVYGIGWFTVFGTLALAAVLALA